MIVENDIKYIDKKTIYMTYLEQKIAIDSYSNYLRGGYADWIRRILDDYYRLITQLNQSGDLGEVVEKLYYNSYLPIKAELERLSEKAATQNAVALDDISFQLEGLIRSTKTGL